MNKQSTYRFYDSLLILATNVGSISNCLLQTAGAEDVCECKLTGDQREPI
ncbi:MAG: hypothetical protein KKB91_12970 [Proteobacteria bacterium]|jgi:hypothetical protein|nr:hypothetical protein [Pseudomonadota bacterium]MCG2742927.1 hypothetical protein [Desulfobacteraceae bacterium]MBU3982327.1 hypothetical protein [Pseudomonadota bacterium]MBU4027922.1 hypothetical protein [Pseudomonadota bacterium]MBU4042408.1 hypothetical protein [Pseudomonadota bacterium]